MLNTDLFSSALLPVALGLIMFSMGLSLSFSDFRNIALHPKEVLVGLLAQMLLLPLFAFVIAAVAPLSPAIKVGIVLVAICPGGATSNLVNYLLNGNLALCVSLTSVNAFLTQFSIPLMLNLGIWTFINTSQEVEVTLPFWRTVLEIFMVTLLPVVLGIIVHQKWNGFAEKMRNPLKYITPFPLAVAMVGAAFLEEKESGPVDWLSHADLIPWLLLLNVGSFALSHWFSGRLGMDTRTRMTISVEVGLQNTGMAMLIATGASLRVYPELAVPAAIYAMFSFFTTAALAWWVSPFRKKAQ